MNLDWEDVRAFVAIARAGSLTQAVWSTGLSQPTLSRKLRNLEVTLGGDLFDRLPNQMVLTSLGKHLVEIGAGMETAAANIARTAHSVLQQHRVPLRVSATMSISLFLSEKLSGLVEAARCHGCEIDIEPTRTALRMAHHQADIAVRLRRVPDEGPMRVRRIGRIAFTMYQSAAAEVTALPVIGLSYNRPPPHPGWVDDFAESRGLLVTARLGEYFLRLEAIRAGAGMSLLPCFVGDRDPLLRRVCDPPEELGEDAFLLLHNQAAATAGVKAVGERIAELFRAEAPLLAGQTIQPPA